MTILNVNMEIIDKNLKYGAFMAVGMAGAFFFDEFANTIAAMPQLSWEYAFCSLGFSSIIYVIFI